MKQIALYILLLSYTTVMLKPVTPYISDAVAHIFYYTKHMATVHYENGKLHVHQEIVNNASKNEPAKETPSSKKENSANDHISLQQPFSITHLLLSKSYQSAAAPALLHHYPAGLYPPPRA